MKVIICLTQLEKYKFSVSFLEEKLKPSGRIADLNSLSLKGITGKTTSRHFVASGIPSCLL